MKTTTERKAALETTLSNVCGIAVELTVRNLSAFTLSAEGDVLAAMEKAKAYFATTGALTNWESDYDEECDQTCAWFNLA